jgi:hypothetical protein
MKHLIVLAVAITSAPVFTLSFGRGSPATVDEGGVVNARQFGLTNDPSCVLDQTEALRSALAAGAGRTLQLPRGTFCIKRADGTLSIDVPDSRIVGYGSGTLLKWAAPKGTKIAPLLDVRPTARRASITDVAFDHGAAEGGFIDSDYFGDSPWGGVMVVIEADDFVGGHLWGRNGFDNCFGVSEIDRATKKSRRSHPQRVRLESISTEHCGAGLHASNRGGPGRIGAGIDNGSGLATHVASATDVGSYGSFIADIGAGASGVWSDLISIDSQIDQREAPALYVGDANNSFANVFLIEPQGTGVWSGAYANGATFTNVNVKAPRGPCLLLKGGSAWSNVVCSDPSYGATTPRPAVLFDASATPISGLSIRGMSVTTALSRPSHVVESVGDHPISGRIEVIWPRDMAKPLELSSSARETLRIEPP